MFRFDERLSVYVHRDPVDFRCGINSLALLVEQSMHLKPMSASLFVFGNRRHDRIKILGWGGNGFWLFLKRLEADRFVWPLGGATISLTTEQLHWLLDGIDLGVIKKHPQRYYERIG
ncbi:IS66 family insertion sequence element accessory protein TnpB (plasmid) [Robbsia andropogonis]|uniref:IS66 family insertion sequence element accessory protein TnpB n=1 Tax=Robbsia andropogonis TaxID=28092 RepID=UPI003D1FD37D